MKLIIDIDEDYYELLKSDVERGNDYKPIVIIANGKPLPKGHGRLIDAIHLKGMIFTEADMLNSHTCYNSIIGLLNNAPTIIEADKEN